MKNIQENLKKEILKVIVKLRVKLYKLYRINYKELIYRINRTKIWFKV